MEKEEKAPNDQEIVEEEEDAEALELVLFQVSECYVYLIPPRKSAASYRADEWDVNKWAWEGILKIISKGEECIIRLEDKKTGELYARAFLRNGEPHPVETVIDSSRYFVLRVEENIGGRLRHAFIGLGFRERTEAYDFQAALHDHMKYLNKKKTAEEMEQQFQKTSSIDYSLKDGETLVLQLKNNKSGQIMKSKSLDQALNHSSPENKGNQKELKICIKPPPPPPAPLSPSAAAQLSPSAAAQLSPSAAAQLSPSAAAQKLPSHSPAKFSLDAASKHGASESTKQDSKETGSSENQSTKDIPDDDFGDFQTAS